MVREEDGIYRRDLSMCRNTGRCQFFYLFKSKCQTIRQLKPDFTLVCVSYGSPRPYVSVLSDPGVCWIRVEVGLL